MIVLPFIRARCLEAPPSERVSSRKEDMSVFYRHANRDIKV